MGDMGYGEKSLDDAKVLVHKRIAKSVFIKMQHERRDCNGVQ